MNGIRGIHHVTAIAGEPPAHVAFYTRVLGLRLVKRTVNFDAPDTWHLYYGDALGRPGTLLTFFLWPRMKRGMRGAGQATAFSYQAPPGSLGWWSDRLRAHGRTPGRVMERFGEEYLRFDDPDGLAVELVAPAGARGGATAGDPPPEGDVPAGCALGGFGPVTLMVQGYERTARLLRDLLGMNPVGEEANRFRFECPAGGERAEAGSAPGRTVDVQCSPDAAWGRVAVGSIHHVAWRARDEESQRSWRERLVAAGLDVTPVIDRRYFKSIYFREPGGVLFELATDPPGMTFDESPESLGTRLQLPSWFEPERAGIEAALPPLEGG